MVRPDFDPARGMTTTSSATPRPLAGKRLGAILDIAARRTARRAGCWCWWRCSIFLPGFFQIPPIDRDEAYFAQATKQMIETGDYVDIRFQDECVTGSRSASIGCRPPW